MYLIYNVQVEIHGNDIRTTSPYDARMIISNQLVTFDIYYQTILINLGLIRICKSRSDSDMQIISSLLTVLYT